jgi:hypothetical protein
MESSTLSTKESKDINTISFSGSNALVPVAIVGVLVMAFFWNTVKPTGYYPQSQRGFSFNLPF